MSPPISTIAFDADDTLWHNENLFEAHHQKYCELLSRFHDAETVETTLYATEMRNLELYGYGVKSFMLSSIETAIDMTDGAISTDELKRIIQLGKEMLRHPVELLPKVESVVAELSQEFRLMLITKGDLRDQERKIAQSGISRYFDHAEVVSEKDAKTYARLFRLHNADPKQLMMVGNSLKSDILPILDLGGFGVYIPYQTTWQHERAERPPKEQNRFHELDSIALLPQLLKAL